VSDPLLTYRGVVYPWHCDHMGHMNVMWYVGKFDEATWQFIAALGLTGAAMREAGTGMVAVDQHVSYSRELRAGDLVSVTSVLHEVKDRSIRFSHEMQNDVTAEVAATAMLIGVHIDTGSRRACPLPPSVRERALRLITSA